MDGKRLFMTEIKMYGDTLIDINRLIFNTYNAKLFRQVGDVTEA